MTIQFLTPESMPKADVQTLVCPVNCSGVMGAGLALTFSKTFKGLLYHYRKACERGDISIADDAPSFWVHTVYQTKQQILCFPVEISYDDPPQREVICRGMQRLVRDHRLYNIKSLGVPMIGCDNGTFMWDDIGKDIVKILETLPPSIPVTVFGPDPFASETKKAE